MKQKFTQDHLVKCLYKETSTAEAMAIHQALSVDWMLKEQYDELLASYRQLPKVTFDASPSAIQNILRYSEQTAVETQH